MTDKGNRQNCLFKGSNLTITIVISDYFKWSKMYPPSILSILYMYNRGLGHYDYQNQKG
jgi:hypothetical protein